MITQAVILCGGKGERLGYATAETPKPLVEVGGKPFITYALNMLKGIGFKDIVLLPRQFGEAFLLLAGGEVRVVAVENMTVNEEVLTIAGLQDLFLLLNGDSFPLMDWRAFVETDGPRVAVKVVGRDAGAAIVRKADVEAARVNCLDIKDMMEKYENYVVLGGLHIGTPQGLQRARTFIDIAVYGQ